MYYMATVTLMDFIPMRQFDGVDALLTHDPSTWTYRVKDYTDHDICSVTEFVECLFPKFNAKKVIEANIKKWQNDPKSPYHGKTEKEIERMWEENSLRAQMLGNELHNRVEGYYNAVALSPWLSGSVVSQPINYANAKEKSDMRHFADFNRNFVASNSWIPYKMEWRIFCKELAMAGTLDALFYKVLPSGKVVYILVDWKFSKAIKFDNKWASGTEFCTRTMDDCNYNKYTIQLCLYAYILKRKYGIFAGEIYLVNMHPSLDKFQCLRIYYDVNLMNNVIAHRYNQLLG